MELRLALPALAVLAVTALLSSPALPANGVVAKPGTIVTVAGTGTPGYSGDNGPATQARLQPGGLAIDGAGNLYLADFYGERVRKVDAVTGIITTVAGTGQPGFSGDNGPATAAQLHGPWLLALDGAGNLFISDSYNHRVRKVGAVTGVITTYAGTGPVESLPDINGIPPQKGGFAGDSGPATDARLNVPVGLVVDAQGNLFIGDAFNNRVRKVDVKTGVITTVAGSGARLSSGDGGPATEAGFPAPGGLAVDAAGNLFITELGSPVDGWRRGSVVGGQVRRVDAVTGIITTVAGTAPVGFSGDGGQAMSARLNEPATLALDSAGNLFIADAGNYRVRKVDAVTGTITTVAGNGKRVYAGDGSLATDTGLGGPGVIALDPVGDLVVADGAPDARVLKVFGSATAALLPGKAFPQ